MTRLSREQARSIDRRSAEEYGIPGIVLMENASRAVAQAGLGMLSDGDVCVVCGGGNNGGDGLAAARHLHNAGRRVRILLATDPGKYQGDALINWNIVQKMGLPCAPATAGAIAAEKAGLIIDAIFGTGLTQPPREPYPQLIAAINAKRAAVLAVDLPSGMDCDTGRALGCCVRATKTVTFVAEKLGFAQAGARQYTGEIIVADIGCPRELIAAVKDDSVIDDLLQSNPAFGALVAKSKTSPRKPLRRGRRT